MTSIANKKLGALLQFASLVHLLQVTSSVRIACRAVHCFVFLMTSMVHSVNYWQTSFITCATAVHNSTNCSDHNVIHIHLIVSTNYYDSSGVNLLIQTSPVGSRANLDVYYDYTEVDVLRRNLVQIAFVWPIWRVHTKK